MAPWNAPYHDSQSPSLVKMVSNVRSGMTILEVLVALVILSTAVLGLTMFLYPAKWNQSAIHRISNDSLLEAEVGEVMRNRPEIGYQKVKNLGVGEELRIVVGPGGAGKSLHGELLKGSKVVSRLVATWP